MNNENNNIDTMDETSLIELLSVVSTDWNWFVDNKNPLAFTEIEIEPKEFAKLVKYSYELIYAIADRIAESKIDHLGEFINIISLMSEYSAEWPAEDESEDKFFTVSRLIAKDLAILGSYPYIDRLGEKNGVINSEVGSMYCYEKECKFNVEEGDFSEYIALAKSGMCP